MFNANEITFNVNGLSFDVHYGTHTNGGDKVQLIHLASDITGILNHIRYNDR